MITAGHMIHRGWWPCMVNAISGRRTATEDIERLVFQCGITYHS